MIPWVAAKLAHKFAPAVVLALAAALVVMTGWWAVRGLLLTAAEGEAATAKANLTLAADANRTNLEAIQQLQNDLGICIGNAQRLDEAEAEMEAARRDMILKQERLIRDLQKQLEARYAADPQCVAFDRQPVCRAVNDRMRTLAGPDGDG